jgi:hypothetical protein
MHLPPLRATLCSDIQTLFESRASQPSQVQHVQHMGFAGLATCSAGAMTCGCVQQLHKPPPPAPPLWLSRGLSCAADRLGIWQHGVVNHIAQRLPKPCSRWHAQVRIRCHITTTFRGLCRTGCADRRLLSMREVPCLHVPASSHSSPLSLAWSCQGRKQQETALACQLVGVAPDLGHPAVNDILRAVPGAPRRGAYRAMEHAVQRELLRTWCSSQETSA